MLDHPTRDLVQAFLAVIIAIFVGPHFNGLMSAWTLGAKIARCTMKANPRNEILGQSVLPIHCLPWRTVWVIHECIGKGTVDHNQNDDLDASTS